MWEVISAVRHTLCLRQYYLDQVFGYNLSTVINLTILSQNKYVDVHNVQDRTFDFLLLAPLRVATSKGNIYSQNCKEK